MSARTFKDADLDKLADEADGPVAFVRQQTLRPVGHDDIVFPPTYAAAGKDKSSGYATDALSDGTTTVLIDSVGSQANRMEALFVARTKGALAELVPQLEIEIERKVEGRKEPVTVPVSIMEAGHRLGDALIRASDLSDRAHDAFVRYLHEGDATAIGELSPTTFVFGAWDSRDTFAKIPRIVQATVRGWDVDVLKRSAQYTPPINYADFDVFPKADIEKAEKSDSDELARRGYVAVPSVDAHGGVRVNGRITRDVTVNLVALRQIDGERGDALRRYVLGLSLVAAAADLDPFYRQGCLLVPDTDRPSDWELVRRDGERESVALDVEALKKYASARRGKFGPAKDETVGFDKKKAQVDRKVAKR